MPYQLSTFGQSECILGHYTNLAQTAACAALESCAKPGMEKTLPKRSSISISTRKWRGQANTHGSRYGGQQGRQWKTPRWSARKTLSANKKTKCTVYKYNERKRKYFVALKYLTPEHTFRHRLGVEWLGGRKGLESTSSLSFSRMQNHSSAGGLLLLMHIPETPDSAAQWYYHSPVSICHGCRSSFGAEC